MDVDQRIELLIKIGKHFDNIVNGDLKSFPGFEKIYYSNPWFTEEFVKKSLQEWSALLTENNLVKWLNKYDLDDGSYDKTVLGLIMAGNIPLVGFHDMICGIVTGINLNIKLSSKDNLLMKWVINKLYEESPELKSKIKYTEEKLEDFNAIIATGSNNTNRYFEYYFAGYPSILRKNRNSVAVLTGNETKEELEKLADDIFLYFGLGCRSISKIFIPQNYNFNLMGNAFEKYFYLKDHYKYANNFDYQYALIAMNMLEHINFQNLLMIERQELYSPVAVVNFEYYSDINNIKDFLVTNNENIQCIAGQEKFMDKIIPLGDTQKPNLNDYADDIDTIDFIINLRK